MCRILLEATGIRSPAEKYSLKIRATPCTMHHRPRRGHIMRRRDTVKIKVKIIGLVVVLLLIGGGYLYFKYYFTYTQKNIVQRKIETITGQDLTITIFSYDGRIIKRWTNVKKITSGVGERNLTYTYFYTSENKYVQIPNSVWYVAEEE